MERLHQLLHSLDQQQVKVLKNYLTGFSTRDSNTKFWELAEYLLSDKNKIPGIKACSMAIYKTKPDGRMERLKNRLYVKVLDSLLIDINTNRDIYEDESHPVQVRLRKKMILYDLLKFTPLKQTVGMEMITDIIATSKRYEFYSILLDAQYILKWNYGMKKGIEFFQKMNAEIAFYEKCKYYSQRTLDIYTELAQVSVFNSKADKFKLEQFLIKSIDELKQYYIETKVQSIGYYLKTFEMTLLQSNKNIEGAKEVAISMIEFLKQNKTVGRRARFGIWYGYLAEFEIEIGNYDSAIKYLYKGREFFTGSALNLTLSKKLEVDALFLKGEYQHAKEIANSLASDDSQVTGDFRRDMMLYYKGCCHFMLGEIRDAARLFNLKFQLTRDRLGWEVNIRLMRIITVIELGHHDDAHAMVEAYSKHIERYQQIKDLNARDRILLKLFRELAREGFAFDRPSDKVYQFLLMLKEKGKDYSWEALSPELIPVHNWVIKKYARFVPPSDYRNEKKKVFKTAARK